MIRHFIFILFLHTSLLIQAQEPVSVHISEKNGLPDKEFYNIIEDNKGFIWLCANKGLFRYDGKEYKKIIHKTQKTGSIFGVQQDAIGRIWCNNISGKFFYVKDEKFILFTNLSKLLKGELANFIVTNKYLWVFTARTIYKVDLETKLLEIVLNKPKLDFGIPFYFRDSIFYANRDLIYSVSKGKIAVLLSTGLAIIDKKGNKVRYKRSSLFNIKNNLFYKQKIADKNMFFSIDLVTKKLSNIIGFEAVSEERIYTEFVNEDEVWLTTNSGVWVYEIKNNKAILKKRFLKDKHITKVVKDKENNYWLTTLNNGVYILPNVFIETSNISLENKNITCLEKVNDSLFFLGTDKGKIVEYNLDNHQEKTIDLPTKYCVSILKYHPYYNTLFISTDEKGIQYDLKTKQLEKISKFTVVKSAEVLQNNDLFYIDYSRVGILKNTNFKNKEQLLSSGKRGYTTYYNTVNQNIYVALVDNLIVYNKHWEKKIITYKGQPIYAKSITKTTNGIVWVVTFNQGILGINKGIVIKQYTNIDKLKSSTIQKIKADKNKLWIILDNAIQVLDVITEKSKTLTKTDGIISYDISGIEFIKNKVYLSSNEGLFSVDKEKCFKQLHPELYFNQFTINDKDTLVLADYQLTHNQNNIKIGFNVNGFTYNQKEKYKYRLKGLNEQWFTTEVGENTMKYNSLPAGKYIFEVQPAIESNAIKNRIKQLYFTIKKPFWETWWFIGSIIIMVLASIVSYYRQKIKIKEQQRIQELEKISLEKELIAVNLTALRSQMNPHFIFNALNSIQDLILKEDTVASYDYIVLFAQLIRSTLNYSNQDFIPIEEEIKFLSVYLELEQLRFGKDFSYDVVCNTKEGLYIPSLLIQPFIENALVHGLLHKTGKKELSIIFSFQKGTLQCVITDNGIGRKKASEISSRQGGHKSFALAAIHKRLEIFKKKYGGVIGFEVRDLYDNNQATGTKIVVQIPFQKKF